MKHRVNISNTPAGIYYLRFSYGSTVISKKIIIN
ncbi:MAG: hypothetical protein B6I20_06985 [Bacteroidetes bacterium 4572_117]|nr:MAG: hypothetical protein B6I20_06985 [Bacteroidetes bacterium 4572_117]